MFVFVAFGLLWNNFGVHNPYTMNNVKVLLYRHKKYTDGKMPVIFQSRQNGKTVRKVLFAIEEKDWDDKECRVKKTHPHYAELNRFIEEALNHINRSVYNAMAQRQSVDMKNLLELKQNHYFLDYIDDLIEHKSKVVKSRSLQRYKDLMNMIEAYQVRVQVSDIDRAWMERWVAWLGTQKGIGSKQTIRRFVVTAKTAIKHAGSKGATINMQALDFRYYSGESIKSKLTDTEIKALEASELTGRPALVRDTFLLQYYLWGASISDTLHLTKENIQGQHIVYRRNKTAKRMTIKINAKAQALMDRYAGGKHILPWMDMPIFDRKKEDHRKYETVTSMVNKELKTIFSNLGIDKPVTTHTARHSFAYISYNKGVKLDTLRQMLGHTNLQVTSNYIKSLMQQDELDDAADMIFD